MLLPEPKEGLTSMISIETKFPVSHTISQMK
jgi:hypothetical protein